MPITKQAIKRMKQNRANHARNKHYSSHMKSMIKLILDYVKKGETEKANKILPKAIGAIDTAVKKNIIHKNNAARKKSRIQKALNTMSEEKSTTEKTQKPSKKAPEKKAEKAESKDEKK